MIMEQLTPRERIRLAIELKETDRIPVDFGGRVSGIAIEALIELKKKLGFSLPDRILNKRLQIAAVNDEILKHFQVDTRHITLAPIEDYQANPVAANYRDAWGTLLVKPAGGYYYDYSEAPLKTAKIEDLEDYPWMDGAYLSLIKEKNEEAKRITENGKYALFTSFKGVFERAWSMRGMVEFFMDMAADRTFAEALLDKILETQCAVYGPYLEALVPYLDVVCFTDDLGSQTAPLISPAMYRELIKPRHAKFVEFIKEKTGAKVALHSCGSIIEFLPDIKEIGVDIINPIQVSAAGMDTDLLKKEYGKHFCFWGAMDTQKVLPFGTPEEVADTVHKLIDSLGKGGGYIFAPAHNIQALTPPENIIKMFDSVQKHYPTK